MSHEDEVLYVQCDKLQIPESVTNMTLEEIDKEIQTLEKQHAIEKNKHST